MKPNREEPSDSIYPLSQWENKIKKLPPSLRAAALFTPSKSATVVQHKSCRAEEVGNKRYTMQFVFKNTYFVYILAGNPRDSPSSPERKSREGCTVAFQLDVSQKRKRKKKSACTKTNKLRKERKKILNRHLCEKTRK